MIDFRAAAALTDEKIALALQGVERVASRRAAKCGPAYAGDATAKCLGFNAVLSLYAYSNMFDEQVRASWSAQRLRD